MNLAEYLAMYDNFFAPQSGVPKDWAYRTYQGMVLALGQPFERKRLPGSFRRMARNLCYRNALRCATRDGTDQYRYVEGYAAGLFTLEHAWVLDTEDGKIFDPTWPFDDEHQDYYGIVFPADWVWRTVVKRDVYGLLCNDWQFENHLLRYGESAWSEIAAM